MNAMSAQVSPQLADLDRQFDANTAHAQQLFAGLTPQQLAQHALVDGWSIAECLEHLTLSLMNPDYLLYIDEETGRAPRGSGPYKKDWLGALLAWSLEPPYRMKTKTLSAGSRKGRRSSGCCRTSLNYSKGLRTRYAWRMAAPSTR